MRRLEATLWTIAYFVVVLAPLVILLLGPGPAQREFWREFSVALGFAGLSLMGLQFVPTARLPFLANVFPLDALYVFHHNVSLLSFGLILAHPVILFINNPYTLRLLNIVTAPWRARAAVVALLGLIALVVSSVWRKSLEIKYEHWHIWHDVFAIMIAGLALYHIFGVDYYTSNPVQRWLWIVLAGLWVASVAYVRLVRPWIVSRRPYEVQTIAQERNQTWLLTLVPRGHPGLTFLPGQFAWIQVRTSPFAFEHHPFSFTSSAEEHGRFELAIRELGDFTSTIGQLDPGQQVYVDGPYGTFSIDLQEAPGYILIAGGIGIAPHMSMLRTMADRGDRRPVILFYGNYSWDTVVYREELEALQERLNLRVVHVLEKLPEGWEGETGYITAGIIDRHLSEEERAQFRYLICGPLPMIDAVESILRRLHVPPALIQSERYEMA